MCIRQSEKEEEGKDVFVRNICAWADGLSNHEAVRDDLKYRLTDRSTAHAPLTRQYFTTAEVNCKGKALEKRKSSTLLLSAVNMYF